MTKPWRQSARCARAGARPSDYDCDTSARGKDYALQIVRAVEACEGCPVIAQCAQWALEEHVAGVVVAGVALPFSPWWTRSHNGAYRAALTRLANGANMHHVVASELCTTPTLAAAQDVIVDRLLALGHGVPMPPAKPWMVWGDHHV